MTSRKAKNKADERARKRALGLVPVEVWVLPDSKEAVREIERRDKSVAMADATEENPA